MLDRYLEVKAERQIERDMAQRARKEEARARAEETVIEAEIEEWAEQTYGDLAEEGFE